MARRNAVVIETVGGVGLVLALCSVITETRFSQLKIHSTLANSA